MVKCKTSAGQEIEVASKEACQNDWGGQVPDGGTGSTGSTGPGGCHWCGTNSMMIRGFSDMIASIGSVTAIDKQVIVYLDLPSKPGKKVSSSLVKLTEKLRQDLSYRATRSILKLAATDSTAVGIGVRLCQETPRGQYLRAQYDRHFEETHRIASEDFALLNKLCMAWLSFHPFCKALLALVDGKPSSKAKNQKLSNTVVADIQAVLGRFAKATNSADLKTLLDEIISEIEEYRGMTAETALEKFRAAPAERQRGARP